MHSSVCIQTFIFSIAILSVVLPKSAEAFDTNFLNFETLNFETKPYVETYLEYIDVAGASMLDFASSGKSLATHSVAVSKDVSINISNTISNFLKNQYKILLAVYQKF